MTMNLRALLDAPMVPDIVVGDLVLDSRQVKPGDAFVAMPGSEKDGRQYISAAFERGASAVLCEAEGAPEQGDSLSCLACAALPVGCVGQPILWVAVRGAHPDRCHRHQRQNVGG